MISTTVNTNTNHKMKKPEQLFTEKQLDNAIALSGKHKYEMSIRDEFAALAMSGMISGVDDPDCEWIATRAYWMANAMMKQRRPK